MAQDLCKYYKMQKFVSYNSGQTWIPLEEYKKGELYEAHSSDCGSGDFQYRWVLVNDGYICDGKDRYTKEVYQYSEDGIVWYNTWPTQYRKATLVERNSPFCDNAGNGQYESGDTDPTNCPSGYFWNGTECECNGEVIDGVCRSCPTNYKYNKTTHQCECQGHLDNNGNCIFCRNNETWDDVAKKCVPSYTHLDPLKIIKCSNSDGVLRQSDVNYYESGWTVLSYIIGDCIYRIDDNAFNGQEVMSSITISDSVTSVGEYAFANCKRLASIYFPSSITSFGSNVFLECVNLENINFGGTIPTVIQPYMFDGCYSLTSANWLSTNNITVIGNGAFRNCTSLSNVALPQTLISIGNFSFFSNYNIKNITIPNNVTNIGNNAFNYCSGMTIANINSNNATIGDSAFANCTSLTAVTVQSSAVTMGNNAFNGCTRLLKITFTSPIPFAIGEHDFDNTNNCMLFVPCESEQAYKTAWPQYADRISCNDTGIYYRWTDTETRYCDGTNEYLGEKQEMTTDGIHWTDSGQYRATKLITHYSRYCGYQGEVGLTVTNDDGYTRYYEPCE